MSVLWRHPQGCLWDGAIGVIGALVGVLAYDAAAGEENLLVVSGFSVLAGIAGAMVAIAIARGVRRSEMAEETAPSSGEAAGWEAEDAPPAPEEPLSEREEPEEPPATEESGDESASQQ